MFVGKVYPPFMGLMEKKITYAKTFCITVIFSLRIAFPAKLLANSINKFEDRAYAAFCSSEFT